MMLDFAKFNILNSENIKDVRRYTITSANLSVLPENCITKIDYFSYDDLKFAEKWKGDHFDYRINDLGFRFEEVKQEIDLAVFGCSFTFGVGLPVSMLWHNILSEKLKFSCLNFGVPGSSGLTTLELFLIVSKHIKIKKAIFLLPSHTRLQIAKKHPDRNNVDYVSVIASYNSSMCELYGIRDVEIFKYLPEDELLKQFRNSVYVAEYVAKNRSIETFYSSWDRDTYEFLKNMSLTGVLLPDWRSESKEQQMNDLARDGKHPGPEHHLMFANKIINLLI